MIHTEKKKTMDKPNSCLFKPVNQKQCTQLINGIKNSIYNFLWTDTWNIVI